MDTDQFIQKLKESTLYAECPCGEQFKLADALLFDGTKPFPVEASEAQQALLKAIADREADIVKKKGLATKRAENTTKSVNIGKSLEKVLPTLKDFKWTLTDTRFMGDPIDLITFDGLSDGKVTSINFIEVKTGNAKLNQHQKSIKDAIEDKKVHYKVFE